MKNIYYTPDINVSTINLDDVILSSFSQEEENIIFENVDVTLD